VIKCLFTHYSSYKNVEEAEEKKRTSPMLFLIFVSLDTMKNARSELGRRVSKNSLAMGIKSN